MAPSARVAVVTGSGSGAPTRSSSGGREGARRRGTRQLDTHALGPSELRIGRRHEARAGGRAATEQQRHAGITDSADRGEGHGILQREPVARRLQAHAQGRAGLGHFDPAQVEQDRPLTAGQRALDGGQRAVVGAAEVRVNRATAKPRAFARRRRVDLGHGPQPHVSGADRCVRDARPHGHRRPQVLQARQRRRHGAEGAGNRLPGQCGIASLALEFASRRHAITTTGSEP